MSKIKIKLLKEALEKETGKQVILKREKIGLILRKMVTDKIKKDLNKFGSLVKRSYF